MKRLWIVLVNCIIILAVAIGVVFYANGAQSNSVDRSKVKFADTTAILKEIASNYLKDSQTVADRFANLVNGTDLTMEEAVAMLQQTTKDDTTSVQLIWYDTRTGMAIDGKASDPENYTVDYSTSSLMSVLGNVFTEGDIHVSRRYNDPQTGASVVAFCSDIKLLDENGVKKSAILMYVVPVNQLDSRWTFPTEYGEAVNVALIDSVGDYVIKPATMKNEDFYDYVYVYNKGTIGKESLKAEMNANESGSFEANNAEGETCFWAYSHLDNNSEWILVSMIPESELIVDETDWTITILLVIALLALLIIDMVYLYQNRLSDNKAHMALDSQRNIINALAEDFSNVFTILPEKNYAEVIKLDGYVTADIDKTTKGFPYLAIVGNYTRDRVHPEDKEGFLNHMSVEELKEAFATEVNTDYSYRVLVDEEVHYYNAHIVRISGEGEQLRLVAGFRNIDALIKEQEENRKILEDALNAAQHANRAKTTFLNSMSHDIRTPMNAIIGFTSLAATHIDNKELVKQYLGKIQVSSNHLLSLINDVLDMSRIESGKVKIVEKDVHLPDILHDLRTIVQSDIKANQLDFFIDTMDVETEDIICDKLRLNQVLLNIVSNAIKFTGPGGHITVKIIQNAGAPEGYAAFTFIIKDTGIGMSQEFLEHIFEPFTRAQTATVSGIQGSGLGMAITKNIVDMMDGTIKVNSEEGVGSEFIVDFTFKKSGNQTVYGPIPELEGASALVADDDMDCCISVCKMLTEIGMRPEWTSSGREAVVRTQYACDRNDPFAVYIVDWLMPDMNGVETVRRIRRIIGEQKPIIVLTSYDWGDIEAEAREAGVTHFVSKPIFMSELRSVLTQPYAIGEEPVVEEESHDFTGARLLLVEDNELNREIAVEVLEEVGFEVDTAEDGSIAVEKVAESTPGQYDLILMDIQMPVMDGYEATRRIRKLENPELAQLPIIAMTANAFEEDKQLAFDAGMNGHVAKPIDLPTLMKILEDTLAPRIDREEE